jgi:hypothetical protein
MNKRDALELKRGETIVYGDSMWTVEVRRWRSGTVQFVTQRGGILVVNEWGTEEWVPYHHVHHRLSDNEK